MTQNLSNYASSIFHCLLTWKTDSHYLHMNCVTARLLCSNIGCSMRRRQHFYHCLNVILKSNKAIYLQEQSIKSFLPSLPQAKLRYLLQKVWNTLSKRLWSRKFEMQTSHCEKIKSVSCVIIINWLWEMCHGFITLSVNVDS